jgi:predicted dehydrogenase
VGCCLRFHDSLLAFREHLAEVGPFYAVEISCRSYLPDWRAGYDYRSGYAANPQEGGVLRDLIHEIDYALWLFGMPESVYCQFANSGQLGIPTEEQASLLWRSDQGVQVSIQLDYLTRNPVRRMAAYGVNGQLGVDLIGQTVTVQKTAALPETFDLKGAKDKMYFDQARAFLRAIDRDDSMQLASGLEGLNALAVCDAARRSDRSQNADKVIL